MSKIAILADLQLGCRSDSQAFLNEHRKFFRDVFFPKLKAEKINTIIIAGDVFDKHQNINLRTLSESRDFFFKHLEGYKVYAIPGNHDYYYKDSTEIMSLEALDIEGVKTFSKPSVEVIDGVKFGFLPWNQFDFPKADVLIGHIGLTGHEKYKGVIDEHGYSDHSFLKKYKRVILGDYHHPSELYVGAPIEMNWNDHGGPRGFKILDTKTLELELVVNPSKIHRKVVYDDTGRTLEQILKPDYSVFKGLCIRVNVKTVNDRYILSQFLQKITENQPLSLSVSENGDASVFEDLIDEGHDTLEMINHYVDGIQLTANKDEVKECMSEVYHEAERIATIGQTA